MFELEIGLEECSFVPFGAMFAQEVPGTSELEINSAAGDHTTVSPDGCAWSDPG